MRRLCPAKVNLYLKVTGRRRDGYHDLITVMQALTLADVLEVEETEAPGITLTCNRTDLPAGPDNLVWRAAAGFFAAVGREPRVRFNLTKRIPLAAGLGGGSSDAGGTLTALNQLLGEPLDQAKLHLLGSSLGADVPFFLSPGPKVGRGIGTDLMPLSLPPYWYLLVNPGIPVSTARVYRNLDLAYLKQAGAAWRTSWEGGEPERWLANDLETVTLRHHPELGELLVRLKKLGARAAGMSGSGPTLFGLFTEREAAMAAASALRPAFSGWLAVARGLTGEEGLSGWEDEVWMS